VKPQCSLQCSQGHATGPCPEPDESSLRLPTQFSQDHSNIIFPFTLRSSEWSLSLKFSDQNLVCISVSPMRATCPTHIILDLITGITFDEAYNLQSSCSSLLPPSLLGPIIPLRHPQSVFSLQCERPRTANPKLLGGVHCACAVLILVGCPPCYVTLLFA